MRTVFTSFALTLLAAGCAPRSDQSACGSDLNQIYVGQAEDRMLLCYIRLPPTASPVRSTVTGRSW
jgi:hypothetical protein